MKKAILNSIVLFIVSTSIHAQSIHDKPTGYYQYGILYAQNNVFGSSKTQSFAGAGVALGGDISSASLNPAGLGIFRKGEFSITGSLGVAATNSDYFGSSSVDNKIFAGLPNFGIVFCNQKDDLEEGDFRGGSFSISFSKVTNFQNRIFASGINPNNSVGDYLAQEAGNTPYSTYNKERNDNGIMSLSSAAFSSSVIDPVFTINGNDTSQVGYQFAYNTKNNIQTQSLLSRGGIYSWDFAYGANYKDKFYFGGGITLSKLNHHIESNFVEDISHPVLTQISVKSTKAASGGGISGKVGIIYRPIDNLRFGLVIQTPTYFSISKIDNDVFDSKFNGKYFPYKLASSDPNYSFSLITPTKFTPAVSYFFGKTGFITSEIQFINYSNSFLNDSYSSFKGDNNYMQNKFTNTINFKLAGEIRISNIRLRAGYAIFGDPNIGSKINPLGYFESDAINNNDKSTYSLTGGLGVKLDNLYIDLAIISTKFNSNLSPYGAVDFSNTNSQNGINIQGNAPAPIAEIKNNLTTFNFTIGTYFGQ